MLMMLCNGQLYMLIPGSELYVNDAKEKLDFSRR